MSGQVREVTEQEVLANVASLAVHGLRCILVVGKAVEKISYAARDGRPAEVQYKVAVAEGDSWFVRFAEGASLPAVHHEGAFLLAKVATSAKNGKTYADCSGWA